MFFSIVIPTFNNASFLKKSIKSVENQTYDNFELIVVDNNSTDETSSIIKECSIKNLIYEKISNNGIIAKSRNLGIKLSKGSWLIFLDADDLIYKEKLNFLNNNLTEDFDLVCTAEKIIDLDSKNYKIWKYGPYENDMYKNMLIHGNKFSTSASVINKDFLIKNKIFFNENRDFVTAEDYDFFLNLVKKGAKVKFFDNILGDHLFYKGSQSSNFKLHKKSVESVLKFHTFQVQEFTQEKNRLWKSLRWRLILMDFINEFKNKKFLKSLKLLIILTYISPIKVTVFFVNKLKKIF